MARRVFFSFHYERDIWRASQVRNSWVTKEDREAAGFWDAASWEEVKKKGEEAVKSWIDRQMTGTSVTVVLIGAETAARKYVDYETLQSHNSRKGMLGIYIHGMKDRDGYTDVRGQNPFDNWTVEQDRRRVSMSTLYPTYNWATDDGYSNVGKWIEEAARAAGR